MYDDDGIDGPAERAWRRAEREDARRAAKRPKRAALPPPTPAALEATLPAPAAVPDAQEEQRAAEDVARLERSVAPTVRPPVLTVSRYGAAPAAVMNEAQRTAASRELLAGMCGRWPSVVQLLRSMRPHPEIT